MPAPLTLPPSKFGMRVVKNMPLEMVLQHLNINELYRLSWGAKNTHGDEWTKLKAEFDARLDKMKREAMREKWLNPQGVYGLFPCQAEGDDLIVYNPEESDEVLTRFNFPRQPYDEHLALSDYYAPVSSGQMDVVAFQVVTVGQEASNDSKNSKPPTITPKPTSPTDSLSKQQRQPQIICMNTFAVKWESLRNQGKRYSWGYPAIPELEDHQKVWQLLPAVEKELGITLSPSYQLIPEQSTAAIIVHHPQAKYYSVGKSRVEQLMR